MAQHVVLDLSGKWELWDFGLSEHDFGDSEVVMIARTIMALPLLVGGEVAGV